MVVTVGLEPTGLTALRLFGQVRYSREPRLEAAVSLLSSPRFPAQGCRPFSTENCPLDSFPGVSNPASSRTAGARLRAPIDVNDVLCPYGMFPPKTTRYSICSPEKGTFPQYRSRFWAPANRSHQQLEIHANLRVNPAFLSGFMYLIFRL